MLKPLMQYILDEELKAHPQKDKTQERKAASLAQELLEKLWQPEEKPTTFWQKVKLTLSDGVNLPEQLFKRVVDFRACQRLAHKKEEMQQVMFYAVQAFRKGTEMLARACYLFNHNPLAFAGYATSSVDFEQDLRQSSCEDENVFMPALWTVTSAGQSEIQKNHADDRRLPLHSFAPIKYGQHPCLEDSKYQIRKYQDLFDEFSLLGFKTDPFRYVSLKKLLFGHQPDSNYPSLHHQAIVVALNEFNKCLEREPVRVCSHQGKQVTAYRQKII